MKKKVTELTDHEGANRVADRLNKGVEIDNEHLYNCEACGAHKFNVIRKRFVHRDKDEYILCKCGKAIDRYAAKRGYSWIDSYTEKGCLNENHDYDINQDNELPEYEATLNGHFDIYCYGCYTMNTKWEIDCDFCDDEEIEHFEVRCSKCNHEIEFGWSKKQPQLIYPCESTDFNPKKLFADYKYYEDWEERGWAKDYDLENEFYWLYQQDY